MGLKMEYDACKAIQYQRLCAEGKKLKENEKTRAKGEKLLAKARKIMESSMPR